MKEQSVEGRNDMGASTEVEIHEKFTAETVVWQNYLKRKYGTVVSTVTNKNKWCDVKNVNGVVGKKDKWRTKGLRKK